MGAWEEARSTGLQKTTPWETASFDVMPLSNRYLLTRASEPLTLLILRRGGLRHRTPHLLVKRCHELRTKPLRDFTVEDLRIMIGQQVALGRLVALALDRLRPDSLVEDDDYPADLLASVLRRGRCVLGTIARFRPRSTKLAEGARRTIRASTRIARAHRNLHPRPFSSAYSPKGSLS